MLRKRNLHFITALLFAIIASPLLQAGTGGSKGAFEPAWESLKKHKAPEWFKDAKFGIYTHWGPVTVGAEDGPGGVQWYGRNMYMPKSPTFEYHRKKFGDQHKFGYKDVVALFRAEKFDAEVWAELFAAAGAKFAGPVVIHHDNFAMWDSAYTEWDSMDKGPKRDFTGELERAIRKRGMQFIATFHHGFAWQYYEPAYKFDAADGKHAGLYCEPHEPGAAPSKQYLDKWLGMVNEVVGKYKPDLLWFDFGLSRVITEPYRKQMFADYYNWAVRNKRKVGVAHKHRDIHAHTGILDFERGREDKLVPYPWLTDTSVGPWFCQKSSSYKSVDQLVDVLVDIVSKNGCMLLNVGPAADGTIPTEARELLLGIGKWLEVNGEAIYDTRPWLIYGEGPTGQAKSGGFSEKADKPYTAEDIRFTRSKEGRTTYAIFLGWPGANKEVLLQSFAKDEPGEGLTITEVSMLGSSEAIKWDKHNDGLALVTPEEKVGDLAVVFQIDHRVAAEPESAAMKRFRTQGLKYEQDNEFYTRFKTSPAIGLGFQEGVVRRDPTDVIKVGDLYYVWYTRSPEGPAHVGFDKATDTIRAYSWDLADLWCATSRDGKRWTERGVAVRRGPKGSFDARSVFTPNVLVASGRYYLFYQAAASLEQGRGWGDFAGNVIAMSWADSPDGPWTKAPQPILKTGPLGAFDHRAVHDPSLIVREGKYWLYYKGHPGGTTGRDKRWGVPIAWGVAVADKPEGPYVKSKFNPVICGGHETIVWPYRKGVCALLAQGPERNSLQYAEDGLNFVPKAHGLDVPIAAGLYRADNFIDTDKQPGPGITWGLFHERRDRWHYLMRFDGNLSLKRGEQIRKKNAQTKSEQDE